MIPKEDVGCLHVPDAQYVLQPEEESALLTHVHNNNIGNIVDAFSAQMDQWRVDNEKEKEKEKLKGKERVQTRMLK